MKRQLAQSSETLTRVASKRALFTSPLGTRSASTSFMSQSNFPRRSLFPVDNNDSKKRRPSASPDADVENRMIKQRRVDLMPKSQSFSIASTSTNTSMGQSFRKQLFCRTQSEAVLNSSQSMPTNGLGFKGVLTDDIKKVKTENFVSQIP